MAAELSDKLESINARLAELLAGARRSLTGEGTFGVEQVRALYAPIAEMAPVMARAAELRTLHPEIAGELDRYKSQLRELQTTIQKVRVMLLLRRSNMDAGRAHVEAVSHWANALSQTR